MATRFWVGGTGTWDNSTTTNWAASSGGAGGQSVPASGDTVTFDASSGAGTCTVAATINGTNTIVSLTCGAMGMTLDFSVNNPSISMGTFSGTGAGTRTIKLGSGTFTITGVSGTVWTMATTTGLTWDAGTSTILINSGATASNRFFSSAALTYATLSIAANSSLGSMTLTEGGCTFANLLVAAPNNILLTAATTRTITNAFAIAGSSLSSVISFISSTVTGVATISIAAGSPSFSFAALRAIAFTGGATFAATNSIDLGLNTGITITAPATGGGGGNVIGD